mgnify:CR=1 FL=1
MNLKFEPVSNQREFINSNHGDMASLAEDYCSLIIQASQFSSTTRNLVLRFKRRGNGGRFWLRNSNESSWSWLLFSKKLIPFVDVFISMLQVIMMKSASFLWELGRTYERIRGYTRRMDLYKVDYLVDIIGEGGRK